MSEALGIETRSRSRSKTPGLLFGENGDSHDKKSKKIPTISLIEEEDDVEVVSSQQLQQQASQKPKRSRRSGKSSQEQLSPESSQSSQTQVTSNSNKQTVKTTTTTTVTSKQVVNGSEEKSEKSTTTATTTTTTVAGASSNDVASEVPESQNIFNNIFNAIKTSTPILSSKHSKRTGATYEVKSSAEIDYNAHPAYKEYKEAGEYWNKYPKTDYTYSELSPHRRELGKGVVAMPNMSRRSLDKYQNRVETMIHNNPTEESFLRRKFLSNMSYQKRSADLQYDSADEVDVSDLHLKLAARRNSQTNFFRRFFLLIVSTISSAYSSTKQRVRGIFYGKNQRYSYTPIKRQQQQGILRGVYNSFLGFMLLCLSKVYLFISTVLCLDTWLLYTRSENATKNRERKRFLLGLLILLPLLLFGALLLSDDTTASKIFTYSHYPLSQINSNYYLQSVTQYISKLSPPSIPRFDFDLAWMWTPFLALGVAFRDFMFGSVQSKDQLKMALDEEKFQILLQHIDTYIDSTIGERLSSNNQNVLKEVNDRLIFIIANNVKEAMAHHEYQLTTKDIEMLIEQVRKQLDDDLNLREKSILAKISLSTEETAKRIESAASVNADRRRDIRVDDANVDLSGIVAMILGSEKLFGAIDGRLKPIFAQLDLHDEEIKAIKEDLSKFKLEIVEKFSVIDGGMNDMKLLQKHLADDLYKFKFENDEALQNFILSVNEKLSTLPGFTSIDQSVRKNLLTILGFNFDDPNVHTMDESSIKNWISSTFIAKSMLEERLHNLELNSNKAFQLQLDKNAGVLMEEINKEIKSQIALAIAEKGKGTASGDDVITEADVLRIVRGVLAVYDADKTGLVDYALESAGGEVISTRCTENYRFKSAEISIFGIPVWYPSNTPRTVISPSIAPGECWAFQGFPGFLVIKLNNLVEVSGFTVEHIPKSNAPNGNIDSAPNNFTVWGLTAEFDKDPVKFGSYYYSNEENSPSLQYFPVQNKEIDRPYQIVELRIESNHGNPKYTCLYRFRVHGDIK